MTADEILPTLRSSIQTLERDFGAVVQAPGWALVVCPCFAADGMICATTLNLRLLVTEQTEHGYILAEIPEERQHD